ncbi:Wadjet anti-phage system protein JetD domain-containing protein [Halomonas nitroreducens]|uniref:Wadjet protein JetD C-terminal domain-containing protein n=1 Tax=Halomonas nitroreducens TaxID=447425 RepID=A0A3S0HTW7_9GAMM|nr:Wadjet anti-phage system protein JetD domain-containing protein [Halomonas nitroreducens]RTR05412.1 hypothetical protein EKG36_07450 [Halomonas nitroreducens]
MSTPGEAARAVQAWLEADWCRQYRRQGAKRWRSDTLVRRLRREGICDSELAGWQALAELARFGILDAPEALRHRVPVRLGLSEGECHRLREGMVEPDASLGLTADQAIPWGLALERRLDDWSLVDQQRLVEGLRRLAGDLPDAYGLSAKAASARYLLGSSKLLEALPGELVRSFGIEPRDFRAAPLWLLAAMPEAPEGLLLIENPQSFAQACRVGLDRRLALVCSFGYGLSLGEVMVDPTAVRLVGEQGLAHDLTTLLALPSATYWGDLDPEGLRIYRRLKARLPALRLSALLEPMAASLATQGGHPLHRLTGKEGQRPADDWTRGIDQEALEDTTVAALGGRSLSPALETDWMAALSD